MASSWSTPLPLRAAIGTTGAPIARDIFSRSKVRPAALREVDHVERDDERHRLARQLTYQHEMTREIGRIGHHDRGRRELAADAGERLDRDRRLREIELQAVEARQVDDFERSRPCHRLAATAAARRAGRSSCRGSSPSWRASRRGG